MTMTPDEFETAVAPFMPHHDPAHSAVQLDYFVVGNGGEGHPMGMYRQALRELDSRVSMLTGAVHARAMLELDREEHTHVIEDTMHTTGRAEIQHRRAVLERAMVQRKIAADDARIAKILREGVHLLARTTELRAELEAANGELTPEVLQRLDEEFWVHSFRQRLAIATISMQPIPRDILTVLPQLPERMRAPIVDALARPQDNIEAFKFLQPSQALRAMA